MREKCAVAMGANILKLCPESVSVCVWGGVGWGEVWWEVVVWLGVWGSWNAAKRMSLW